jgi:hypothetical protein
MVGPGVAELLKMTAGLIRKYPDRLHPWSAQLAAADGDLVTNHHDVEAALRKEIGSGLTRPARPPAQTNLSVLHDSRSPEATVSPFLSL